MFIELKCDDILYSKLSIGKILKLQIKVPDGELVFEKAKVVYFDDNVVYFEILDAEIGVDVDESSKFI